MKFTRAGMVIVGMCGILQSAGCLNVRCVDGGGDQSRGATAEADRATFLDLEKKAREASLAALAAEKRGEYNESIKLCGHAYTYYRTLASASRYKTCCLMFAQKKYSDALDMLLDFQKNDPDVAQFVFSKGGGYASKVYVCLYFESGKEAADGWLGETLKCLDEKGRLSLTILTDATLSENDIATAKNGLSKWQKDQIIMYRRLLAEIDAAGDAEAAGKQKAQPKFEKGGQADAS